MAKILVIEDEPDQNKLIKLRLEARGFRVISVGKAKDGIDVAKKERPDLVLMDMILPDMHGLDATIKLKESPETKNIPVIAISAVGSPDFVKACSQEGIVAYIKKPYDPRELFKTIEKYVKIEDLGKGRAKPEAAKDYQEKIAEIEIEFRKPTPPPLSENEREAKKEVKQKQKVEDMLKAALADFKISMDKLSAEEKSRAPKKPKPKSVLVVDDDTSFGRAVASYLIDRGYEVNIAPDGVSGLKHAFQRRPDLILLNLVLPAGGGETVLANLRKAPETQHTPVFIMSSLLSSRKLEEKAHELGAQGFIAKPVEPADLLYIIESIVGE